MAKRIKSTSATSKRGAARASGDSSRPNQIGEPDGSGNESSYDPRERIAARAYELYLQRGATPGQETDDWLEAERELLRTGAQPLGRPDGA